MALTPGQLYWWEVPRVLSPQQEAEIDARLAAAELDGTYDDARKKDENRKSDERPALVLRSNGSNVLLGMCTTQDYTASGAIVIEPNDVTPAGALHQTSYMRQDKVWFDHEKWNSGYLGKLKPAKFEECKQAVSNYVRGDS